MVMLFSKCRLAHSFLNSSPDLKKRWWQAVEWLNEELDRVLHIAQSSIIYFIWYKLVYLYPCQFFFSTETICILSSI